MAGSVFKGAAVEAVGSMSGNKGGISGGPAGNLGIVTNVSINFAQQISRIFDLNKANANDPNKGIMYYVGGRATGNLTIGRIIGPTPAGGDAEVCNFYHTYGNICNLADDLTITFIGQGVSDNNAGGDCNDNQETKFTMKQPMITNLGVSQNSSDTLVTENLQFQFADLECD